MKKTIKNSEYMLHKVFCVFIFLNLFYFSVLYAQDTREGKISQDLKSESEYEISEQDPSPAKAQEAAEKKQSLEELLAVPLINLRKSRRWDLVLRKQNHLIM